MDDENDSSSSSSTDEEYKKEKVECMPPQAKKAKILHNSIVRDRFSYLPDSTLHEILSYLDMKEVGLTSLVSRRCRYLWRDVPRLNFNHGSWKKIGKNSGNKLGFINMVDHVLEYRNHNASSMQELRLYCGSHCFPDKINNWVVDATIRNVQALSLEVRSCRPQGFKLPDIIFNSKVEAFDLLVSVGILRLPDSMCLASQLRTMNLEKAELPKGDRKGSLALSCPILESLSLINCVHRHLKILNISTPQLKNLVIHNNTNLCTNNSCELEIRAPQLISVHLKGYLYKGYSLGVLHSLVNAKLDSPKDKIHFETLISIIEGIRHARHVELSCRSIKNSEKVGDMSAQLVNTYTPLKCLRLIGWSNISTAPIFQNLLRGSPHIESLAVGINQVQTAEDWRELFVFIGHLKSVEIRNIKGLPEELEFFKFLFENAVVLQEFTAVYSDMESEYEEDDIISFSRKIRSLPKASSSVSIVLILKTVVPCCPNNDLEFRYPY